MTVKELFESVNFKPLARKMAEEDWNIVYNKTKTEAEKEEMKNRLSDRLNACFINMLNIEPILDSDSILYCTLETRLDEEDSYFDASLVYRKDLAEKEIPYTNFDDDTREFLSFSEYEKKYIQSYAFEFKPWAEILGSQVAEASIEAYGAEMVCLAIFNEMTFFGADQEAAAERADFEKDILLERAKEVEDHPERMIPIEDVLQELYKDLGVEPPTKKEKEESRNLWIEEMKINQEERYKILNSMKKVYQKSQ